MAQFNLSYENIESGYQTLTINSGQIMFLVGQNGTGKSTLMQLFAQNNQGRIRRITAHRQVWLNSDSIDLTPSGRGHSEKQILSVDVQDYSRFKDDHASVRSQITLFDLIDSENIENQKIALAARAGDNASVQILIGEKSPFSKLNEILRLSNLHFQVQIDVGSKLIAIRENCNPYSIAELSDGERNGLLIIANILTAPKDTLILLDEPERHLHRSIVSPLISTLLTYRPDCAFVISTHDVTLPHDQEDSSALLLRHYSHQPKSWVADFIDSVKNMDEGIANAVLGSRRKLVFIEGIVSSLDLQLYQILLPKVSIKPLGSCTDVEKVVQGIKESNNMHWIKAIGIIDRDNRSDDECEKLKSNGIFALDLYSVESLYYHPIVIKEVLERVKVINGLDVNSVLSQIYSQSVKIVNEHKERLAARMVERKVKESLSKLSPSWKNILNGTQSITLDINEILKVENKLLEKHINDNDFQALIIRYPLRETPALDNIAKLATFFSREKYEQAVRIMLIENPYCKNQVLDLIKPVVDEIES